MTYQLGVYEKAMPDMALSQKLACAKRAGYDWMEISIDETEEKLARLDFSLDEMRALAADLKAAALPIHTMCLSGHRKYPLGGTDPRNLDIMRKAIDFAAFLQINIIQLAGYDVYYEPSGAVTVAHFEENLRKSVAYAEQKGILLAFETMETPFMNTATKALAWVQKINSPFLRIYPDVGNITNAGVNPVEDLRAAKGYIAAAHLKETLPGLFRDLEFGAGHVDFKAVIRELTCQGVTMYNAEFWYDKGDGWETRLSRNRSFFDQIFEEVSR